MNNSKNNKIRHSKVTKLNNTNKHELNTDATKTHKITNKNTIKQTNTSTKPSTDLQNAPNNSQSKNEKQQTLSHSMSKKRKAITAIIIIGGTLIIGILAAIIGGKMREGYQKPPAYPPDWLFSIIWPILYIMIGISAYLAFISSRSKQKRTCDMSWYGIHLFFNFLWPLFYFRLNLLIFSCIWLLFNVISAIIVTYKFFKARTCSGTIFTIYTLWLLYALYLSLGITMLNISFI